MTDEAQSPSSPGDDTDQIPLDFSAFHAMNRPLYVRYAERQVGSRADAEEVVDETFEQLLIGWEAVLRSKNLAAYAQGVLKNRVIDFQRAQKRRHELHERALFETVVMQETDDPIGQLEESSWLRHAVSQLSPARREVAILLHYEGLSIKETAAFLGLSETGVRSTNRYVRIQLEELLAKEEEDR